MAGKGKSNSAKVYEEYIDLLKYAVNNANCFDLPFKVARLCQKFKEDTGSTTTVTALRTRIIHFRADIFKLEEFDKNTKVKMMFALGASISSVLLRELNKDADVVKLDEKQRIIKYKSKDGSLILEGDHNNSVKMKATAERKRQLETSRLSGPENEEDDEDVDTFEEEKRLERKKSNRRESVQSTSNIRSNRSTPSDEMQNDLQPMEVTSPSEVVLNQHNGNGSSERRIKNEGHAEIQTATEQKNDNFCATCASPWTSSGEVYGYTFHHYALKALHTIVVTLDQESLAVVQGNIEAKMESAKRTNETIKIETIGWALNSLLDKIQNSARMEVSRSTSLKEILLLLRQAVVSLGFPALDEFQQKLRDLIRSLVVDMVVPIEKIQKALETALDVIDPN